MSEYKVWFTKKLMEQLAEDYKTPKISAEIPISSVLSIFIEDLVNHQDLINLIYDEDEPQGNYFKFFSKEFPLKKVENNSSDNMDYLLINDTTLLIVELKTNSKSFNEEQMENYKRVKKIIENETKSAGFLIDELKMISQASKESNKYHSTYQFLLDKDLERIVKNTFNKINKVKILYIAPFYVEAKLSDPIKFISFNHLSDIQLSEEDHGKNKSLNWEIIREFFLDIEELNKKFYE
jgi:hypothetical protein